MVIIGVVVFFTLLKITAGYGQHISKKWGPSISDKLGWFIMEVPTVILYVILYIFGNYQLNPITLLFSGLFLFHYGYRSFIFPLLIRGKRKMPWSIIAMGIIFNTANAYLQGRWINTLSGGYDVIWITSPLFIVGLIVFFSGFLIHFHSDRLIRRLRKPGENDYKIPHGGLFEYVSCPTYLGEITEWIGWAIMTCSFPGFVFAFWTGANLIPRARSNHRWYKKTFGEEYPKNRKALIPFIF